MQSLGDFHRGPWQERMVPGFLSGHLTVVASVSFPATRSCRIDLPGARRNASAVPARGQGTWGENGIIVFGGAGNPLRAVSASGGDPFRSRTWIRLRPKTATCILCFFQAGGVCCFARVRPGTRNHARSMRLSLDSKATTLVSLVPGHPHPSPRSSSRRAGSCSCRRAR